LSQGTVNGALARPVWPATRARAGHFCALDLPRREAPPGDRRGRNYGKKPAVTRQSSSAMRRDAPRCAAPGQKKSPHRPYSVRSLFGSEINEEKGWDLPSVCRDGQVNLSISCQSIGGGGLHPESLRDDDLYHHCCPNRASNLPRGVTIPFHRPVKPPATTSHWRKLPLSRLLHQNHRVLTPPRYKRPLAPPHGPGQTSAGSPVASYWPSPRATLSGDHNRQDPKDCCPQGRRDI
jgi:hypothetical protein